MQGVNRLAQSGRGAELGWADVHGESIADVAWSPSGHLLIAGCADGELCAYQADDDYRYRTLAHQDGITRVCPSPDGDWLATTGEDGKVLLWAADSGELLATLAEDENWAEHLAWSTDGKLLAGAAGQHIYIRDEDGRTETWNDHPGIVAALAWAPNSRKLASAANKGVYLWHVGTWQPTQVLKFSGAAVSLAWSYNGRALAAGTQDGFLHIRLDLSGSTTRQLSMSGYPGKVVALDWHPTTLRIATCGGTDVVLWDLDEGKGDRKATPLRSHLHTVTTVAYNPTGNLLASADRGGRLCIWGSGNALQFEMVLGAEITAIAWHPDVRQLAVGTVDGVLRLFTLGEE